jgi:hypothetical protein
MFSRILDLQQNEYGPHDRRCYVTIEKIHMVQRKGIEYEGAIEELRKTFSMPEASVPTNIGSEEGSKGQSKSGQLYDPDFQKGGRHQKNKVMKVLNSIRKKKPQ